MKEATIVCFGDSITYGYCADYGTDYVSLLRKQLKEDFPQMDITVKNKGENGETSREGLRRLEGDVLHYNPQLVIMLFGSNDCAFSAYQHRGIEEFEFNYDKIINAVQDSGSQLVLLTPPPVIEDDGMPFIENSVLNTYCDIIKRKAEEYGLMLIDMNKAFNGAAKGDLAPLLQWDGVHISTLGYKLFFETVYKHIKPLIEELAEK